MDLFLLWVGWLGVGCTPETSTVETGRDSYPVSLGEEVICADPVEGFERFRDEAESRGITPGVGIPSDGDVLGPYAVGVAAVDGDDDGDIDLFFPDLTRTPQVYENDGAGVFTRVESQVDVPPALQQLAPMAAFGLVDLTGDGLVDLLGFGHRTVLFAENLGSLRFGPLRPAYLEEAEDFGFNVSGAWADADGDGDLDLLLPGLLPGVLLMGDASHSTDSQLGAPERLLLNEEGEFVLGGVLNPEGDEGAMSLLALWTDQDRDGTQDLLVPALRSPLGFPPTALYINQGEGTFVNEASDRGADLEIFAMGVDSADLNQDGHLDHCITDDSGMRCLVSDGIGGFYEGAPSLGMYPPDLGESGHWSGWSIDIVDFDNDGHLDAVAAAGQPVASPFLEEFDYTVQPDVIWRGLSGGGFERVDGLDDFSHAASHYGLVTADLDGDGFLEIVVVGGEDGVHAWWNQCSDGAWIELDLAGPWGNIHAVGARVELESEMGIQVQEVHGQRGYGQSPLSLHFGLGDVEEAECIRVFWPDGTMTESFEVPTRRRVSIPHPSRLVGGDAPPTTSPWSWSSLDEDDETGVLEGVLTRSVSPSEDGVGTAWIYFLESNPMDGSQTQMAVLIHQFEADLAEEGAGVEFRVEGIPLRNEPYYLMAVLDDDRSGGGMGPASGDLINLGNRGQPPMVTVDELAETSQDIDLNFLLP